MKTAHIEPEMPPCHAPHMVGYLFEIGPTMAAGMGNGPITHGEIESWQRNTGITLDAWESRTLKRLSLEYLNESYKSEERDCPPPFQLVDMTQENRDAVAHQIKNAMRSYFMAQGKS